MYVARGNKAEPHSGVHDSHKLTQPLITLYGGWEGGGRRRDGGDLGVFGGCGGWLGGSLSAGRFNVSITGCPPPSGHASAKGSP